MFVYIYVCKHQITYIILLIKRLQKQLKRFSNIHVFMFFGLRFNKQSNIITFKHKRTEYKKVKETVKQHYKESRADSSSRRKHLPPYSTLLTSTRNITPQK